MEIWAYGPLLTGIYDNPAKPIPEVARPRGHRRAGWPAWTRSPPRPAPPASQLVFAWLPPTACDR